MKLFDLGQLVFTPGVLEAVDVDEVGRALSQHASGEWGAVDPDDRRANDEALESGGRLFSAYVSSKDVRFWVITEAVGDDGRRASTCVLLPEEY